MPQRAILYRSLILAAIFALTPALLEAQLPTDMRVSVEPASGGEALQRWPAVFSRNGKIFATWGELRYVDSRYDVQYTFAEWANRSTPGGVVVSSVRPDVPTPDPGISTIPYLPARSEQWQVSVFDGVSAFGSIQYAAFITQPPAGTDTVYKTLFKIYIPTGAGWKSVEVFNGRKSGGAITVQARAYGYDPNSGEVICAWKTSNDPNGSVTSIDTAGTRRWTVPNIPLPIGRYNLVPLGEKKFLLVIDSIGIRYNDGVAEDTIDLSFQPGLRYQRFSGDRFLRSFVSPDTSHYIFEFYDLNANKVFEGNVFNNEAQTSYFVTQSAGENGLAIVAAGSRGVYSQVVDGDLTPRTPVFKVSSGSDTAYSPAAYFTGDSLYIAWSDDRDGESDIYGFVIGYGGIDPGSVPGESEEARRRMAITAITPNPASSSTTLDLTLAQATTIDIDIVNMTGEVVRNIPVGRMEAGSHPIEIPVGDLPSGSYRAVLRSNGMLVSRMLVIVR